MREDYISFEEYFMGIAILSAKRSKDPSTQVGSCIVSKDKRILSIGYNGTPNGIDDSKFTWEREGKFLETKYPYVIHSEINSIVNFRGNSRELENATMYVTLFPCNECAKMIIQSGIKKIIYLSDKYKDTESTIASKKLFDSCGVTYEEYKGNKDIITLEFV